MRISSPRIVYLYEANQRLASSFVAGVQGWPPVPGLQLLLAPDILIIIIPQSTTKNNSFYLQFGGLQTEHAS
jgi:hypothetical protein